MLSIENVALQSNVLKHLSVSFQISFRNFIMAIILILIITIIIIIKVNLLKGTQERNLSNPYISPMAT